MITIIMLQKFVDQKMSFLKNPNLVFLLFLLAFVADNVVNVFVSVSVFVPFTIIMLPFLWWRIWFDCPKKKFIIVFTVVFLIAAIVSATSYGLYRKNIADLVFILLFGASFYYFKAHIQKMSLKYVVVFFAISASMLMFSFAGINSHSRTLHRDKINKYLGDVKLDDEHTVVKEFPILDNVSFHRKYKNGLFRTPEVAGCFTGFLAFMFAFMYFHRRNYWYLLAVIFSLFLFFNTGARTFIVAFVLSVFIFFFRRRTIYYGMSLLVVGILLIIFRYELFNIFKETFAGAYFFMVVNVVDNYDGITRFVMIKTWWIEMQTFNPLELLTGKGLVHSMAFNRTRLNIPMWLHNDFISIAYCYGVPAMLLYILLFVEIIKTIKKLIISNFFIFTFFTTMIFAAIISGLYYYFPLFLLFCLMFMVKMKKGKTLTVEADHKN